MEKAAIDLPENARCDSCGYSIHGLHEDRCPECGNAFDRALVLARLQGLPVSLLPFDATAARWFLPPPWWATVLAVFASVTNLAFASPMPANDPEATIVGIPFFAVAFGVMLLRMLDRSKVPRRYDPATVPRVSFGWNRIVLPIACILCLATADNDICMRTAFVASQYQMTTLAKHVMATHTYPPDQRVGFFDCAYISPTADGVNFRIVGHLQCGFAYTTTGQPPGSRPWAEPLGGGWYAFRGQ
jgi:hypothetical protein